MPQLETFSEEVMAIIALPGFQRFAFVMSVLEGYSNREAALLLDCSVTNSSRRSHALQKIGGRPELHRKLAGIDATEAPRPGRRRLREQGDVASRYSGIRETFQHQEMGMAMKEQKKVGMNVFRNQHLMLAATALALAATVACSRGNVQAAPAMPLPLVSVVKATAQDVPRYLDEIGRNAAFEAVTVTPQVGGRIVERHFQDGENLAKGQLLFVIDPRPYKARSMPLKRRSPRQRPRSIWRRFSLRATKK